MISNFKDGGDIQPLFVDLVDPTKEFQNKNKPVKPEDDSNEENPVDKVDQEIYKEEIKQFANTK